MEKSVDCSIDAQEPTYSTGWDFLCSGFAFLGCRFTSRIQTCGLRKIRKLFITPLLGDNARCSRQDKGDDGIGKLHIFDFGGAKYVESRVIRELNRL